MSCPEKKVCIWFPFCKSIYRTVTFYSLQTISNSGTPLIQRNKSILSYHFLLYQSEFKQNSQPARQEAGSWESYSGGMGGNSRDSWHKYVINDP